MPGGRPSLYSKELVDEICERIATQPRGLDLICDEDDDMPSARTVHSWLNDPSHVEFLQGYLRAKERQADLLFDQALSIADTPEAGEIVTDDGEKVTTKREDMLGHRRLKVETRLRMAGKLAPKKYGDLLKLTGGDGQSPIVTVQLTADMTPQQAAEAYSKLLDP